MTSSTPAPASPPRLLVVTAGTDHHRFDRLTGWVERWLTSAPCGLECVVQHGTSRPVRGVRSVDLLPRPEMLALLARATAVVTQGGPGAIMECRDAGRLPIVVPRRVALGEHVDDHQLAFARRLHSSSLALLAETFDDFAEHLDRALANPDSVRIEPEATSALPGTVMRFAAAVDDLMRHQPSRRGRAVGGLGRRRRADQALQARSRPR